MQNSEKVSIDLLDTLCEFVQDWSKNSNSSPELIIELLLEIDLTIHQLRAHAEETEDDELFQFCIELQNNLEKLQEVSTSAKQLELLCTWPVLVRKFLANRNDEDIVKLLKAFLCDSNWPTRCNHQENDVLQSSQSQVESITHEIEQNTSYIQQPDFLIGEPTSEEQDNLNEYSPEQQELLDLMNAEILDIQESHVERLSNIDQFEDCHESLLEVIEIQIDQADRIGSAAEMIGLHGLNRFCDQLQKILIHIQSTNPKQLISLQEQILLWPDVVQAYLFAPNDADYIQASIDYLSQDCWPLKLSQQKLKQIEAAFGGSVIEIDTSQQSVRMREATSNSVSLEIPEDVHVELVNSLLVDLPKQTEELSIAVQNLRNENFLDQLELAKRIAHTLKGAGNTVGISGLANLTHHLEDILEALLKAKTKPSNRLYDAIQNAADCLEEMSEYLQGIGQAPVESVQILQEILNWANDIDEQGVPIDSDSQIDQVELPAPINKISNTQTDQNFTQDENKTNDATIDPSLRVSAYLIDDLLKRADENIISNAQIQDLVLRSKEFTKLIHINNNKIKALVQELEHLIEIRGFSARFDPRSTHGKFDPLEMDQFNELHTFTNQLMETSADSIEFSNTIEVSLLKLEKLSLNQARDLRENQEAVLHTRMISVESIVPRLKRSVRQACKLSNKTAQLEISGENTLIDSEFLNQLVDPLMHLLRNAIDHGIEAPEFRMTQGKNAEGKIQLAFKKEGNLIHVVCQDDGHGLDLKRIKSKALEKKLIDKNDKFTKEDAIQIILYHGFSTKDEVSQLSGRGVGLDAVFANVREMKGSMDLDTNFGHGVKVELAIPTSFHRTHALLVSCAGNTLAISNRGVEEILYPGAGTIINISGRTYFQHQNVRYPVFDLQTTLYEKKIDRSDYSSHATLIIRDDLNNKHAIMAERIFDTRDIVIKPFSRFIPKISGLIGTTILGDGSVTTVIDLVELLNTPSPQLTTSISSNQNQISKKTQHCVLIVEDAISTRKSLALFMHDLGFEVETAKDGVEAIDQIQKQIPTIVLTDLEMPRMNGLELTDHLRSNKETANIPIVMITSRSTGKHKKEAERMGVTAYMTKPYDEDELLNVVNSFGVAV